jgi:hypothetical protein
MSSPRTGSRSRLPKLQPGGRQKQTAPQESPLPSRAHANPGHSEGSTYSITLGCPVVGSSETRTGDGSASAGRWTGWPPDCCLSCRAPKSRPRKGVLTCLPKCGLSRIFNCNGSGSEGWSTIAVCMRFRPLQSHSPTIILAALIGEAMSKLIFDSSLSMVS